MNAELFSLRRQALIQSLAEAGAPGAVLLMGHVDASRNYAANVYPFRQDSHVLYFSGVERPGVALLLEPDGTERLYGPAAHPDDVVWTGPRPGLERDAALAGLAAHADLERLAGDLAGLKSAGVRIHWLPPHRAEQRDRLSAALGLAGPEVVAGVSSDLAAAVTALREIKTDGEIAEMETALAISAVMYQLPMRTVKPGLHEVQVVGALQGVALSYGMQTSFPPICSVRGEVLHNEHYENALEEGQLLLIDSGVESPHHYCSDITRTIPVGGVFTPKQREIYQVVLDAQEASTNTVAPGATNLAVHLAAARAVASGLKDAGLMRGDPDEAVAAGAHALFFPHGIGHMIGLDVHDMEDLGDVVGYAPGEKRSEQFGLNYLRLAKELKPGFAITIEPGIYFIPALIDRWRAAKTYADFIDYDAVEKYRGFGGIRLEDDVLVTAEGRRILGPPIPKTPEDIELVMLTEI